MMKRLRNITFKNFLFAIGFQFFIFHLLSCGNQEIKTNEKVTKKDTLVSVELFAIPRNINFVIATTGDIFQYSEFLGSSSLVKEKFKLKQNMLHYCSDFKIEDSLFYEYYYTKLPKKYEEELNELISSLKEADTNKFLSDVRMVIRVNSSSAIQDFEIDKNLRITYNDKLYDVDSNKLTPFLDMLPYEIRYNWINNTDCIELIPIEK